jgi:cytochrome P450
VFEYAEPVSTKGFVYMDTPGYDPVSATGQVAGGANLVCFTTGRGSVYGCRPSPSIKLATNSVLYERMSDDMALFIGSSRTSSEKYDTAEQATQEMAAFFRDLINQRRAHPKSDLITELVELRDGDDRLSEDELVATCILLLFAGHETTTNHIANGMLSLMRFPEQMHKLRQNPDLSAAAVEELLRYDGPSGAQVRLVAQPYELHGKTLQPGERIFIMLNSANRDPRAYTHADQLDLERDGVAHLTFGYGMHICLGFPLARTEGQVAFPKVLEAFSQIEPVGEQSWINSLVFRGMHGLPVRVKRT